MWRAGAEWARRAGGGAVPRMRLVAAGPAPRPPRGARLLVGLPLRCDAQDVGRLGGAWRGAATRPAAATVGSRLLLAVAAAALPAVGLALVLPLLLFLDAQCVAACKIAGRCGAALQRWGAA